jgi:hypothetical protein
MAKRAFFVLGKNRNRLYSGKVDNGFMEKIINSEVVYE